MIREIRFFDHFLTRFLGQKLDHFLTLFEKWDIRIILSLHGERNRIRICCALTTEF